MSMEKVKLLVNIYLINYFINKFKYNIYSSKIYKASPHPCSVITVLTLLKLYSAKNISISPINPHFYIIIFH